MNPRNRIRSHRGRTARFSLVVLCASFSLGLGGAGADELSTGMVPVSRLADRPSPKPDAARSRPLHWLGENWFLEKHVGLEYRRELKLGGHSIELGLQGPLVRKKKRAAGATVEIRF